MIPSDHFVRYYNEVFKTLEEMGHEHLVAYWRELGRLQTIELAEAFRAGGLQAAHDYWRRTLEEENCRSRLTLTDDYLEVRIDRCPSLAKVLDNDATASDLYCDHCMAWVEPATEAAGLHAVCDMRSRREPHCVLRVYKDREKAEAFAAQSVLPADPYGSRSARADTGPAKRAPHNTD